MPDDSSSGRPIDVPYVSQGEDDVGCVWACIKMVIEFHLRRYPDLPNLDVEEVKDGVGYKADGTRLEGVTGVNRMLKGTRHELVFDWLAFADFSDIEKELANGVPVIAWIKQNRESDIHHSIVIRGANKADLRIHVNDPDPDEASEHRISDFMKAWETGERILIRAQVRERATQRKLDDQ